MSNINIEFELSVISSCEGNVTYQFISKNSPRHCGPVVLYGQFKTNGTPVVIDTKHITYHIIDKYFDLVSGL